MPSLPDEGIRRSATHEIHNNRKALKQTDQILQGDLLPPSPRKLEEAEDAKCRVSGSASANTVCPFLANTGCQITA